MQITNKQQVRINKLAEKIAYLETKLFNENCRENEMLNRRGWGYGMRNSKIGFSTTKSDSLRDRISKAENELKILIESK